MDIEKYAVCPVCGGWLTYIESEIKLSVMLAIMNGQMRINTNHAFDKDF